VRAKENIMARILAAVVIVAALLFAFAAPCHAASPASPRASAITRIKDKVSAFRTRHAGKLALGSVALIPVGTVMAIHANGVPLKVAAVAGIGLSAYSALRHGVEYALENFVVAGK
jgi:Na+/H+ antiporter NhaC